jgi:hypothetical protein
LDPVNGAIVDDTLSVIEQELFEADWKEAQRRADALVEMAIRAATAPAGGRRPRPLFTVLVDYPTMTGRVCELFNGTVITPGTLARWLSEADVERVVFDGPSRVIDVGVRSRFFTGATRRAVEVRDRRCTWPGCDAPAQRCDVDHIVDYTDHGGETTQANGTLRCPYHHRLGHRRRRRADPTARDPDDDPQPE